MLKANNDYILESKAAKPQKVVSIPVPLFESMEGKYFVGQTDILCVKKGVNAWAALVNPYDSAVNLYTNVFTISNFSNEYLTAEIWLNTNKPPLGSISDKVSPTNTSLNPLPKNEVNIQFVKSTTKVPIKGVNVYKRIVPPNSTLVSEEDGKFISAPSGNYSIIIKSSSQLVSKVITAFGWFERSILC
ncbi:DUF6143 family protein [Clostridium sp. BL-8]|uniref:DUF6143 family protein n=1 Tax=Clostridium sp. BL-8 TaxID=349938 RepID=UPI00098C338A|nr:DUF6143 family protein [Clostridium sp. BL-8]OOM79882.1 hypothetical protein CLOBL_14160 [Clostridium sp. BL-8]